MSERHPLAKTSVLTQDLLSQAVEIVCDDTSLCTYLHESPDADHNENSIHIHERGSQFDLLAMVPHTYMWVSPMPPSVLRQHGLTEKPCADGNHRYRDVLVYRNGYKMGKWERLFLEELEQVKAGLMGEL